jgi:Fe-S cluster assembly iron-binding protein IscA
MKTRNDLEKEKFYSDEWNIVIKNESVAYWEEIGADFIWDLEEKKFNENWEVRVAIIF